jgi:replication-associated recombination protein RarA
MSRPRTNGILDQYELAVDQIVAACDGDVRSALRALMLVNEELEQRLERISAQMDAWLRHRLPYQLLH